MPKPRTPTKLLELRGSFAKNPQRARPNEPEAAGEFPKDPPKHLSREVKKCWRELVRLVPAGVLQSSDQAAMEQFANVLYLCREREWRDPALMIRLEACLGRFGLTPADRSRVSAPPPKPTKWSKVSG